MISSIAFGKKVLGIETSCDETAASVVSRQIDGTPTILSNTILSQIEAHAAYGGVVPEIAARAHTEALDGIITTTLDTSGTSLRDIDAIAVSSGPGLVGGLIAGTMTAKAIAAATAKPLFMINHLEGHALTARLTDNLPFPYLLLLISGGHTQILCVRDIADYQRWGTTIDDAAGEAFDKTAKLLGLPYPGGPSIQQAAQTGNPERHVLPRPMAGRDGYDFSFSGLKTAVRQLASRLETIGDNDIADICASFQATMATILVSRCIRAMERFRTDFPDLNQPNFVAAGGVAANRAIRSALADAALASGFQFVVPPLALCTDNAAMIGWAGLERLEAGLLQEDAMCAAPRPRWPLDPRSNPATGSGKRGAKA